jgi:lysozyme
MEHSMELSFERIYKELSQEEGVRYLPYKDTVGIWTVGLGHNMQAMPVANIIHRPFGNGDKLTPDESAMLFRRDLTNVFNDLDKRLPWWRDNDAARQYVLISLCFNLGIAGLIQFKNTLAAYQSKNWTKVVSGLKQSKWYKQVAARGPKLCNIITSGTFPDGGTY